MAVRRKGRQYQADFMVNGVRHRRSFSAQAEAEAWELETRAALKRGKTVPQPRPKSLGGRDAKTIGGALRSAESLHWGTQRAGGTSQISNAQRFVDWCGPDLSSTDALTIENVRRFLVEKLAGRANSTRNKYISAISVLAEQAGVKLELPWFEPEKGTARQRFFSPDEEREVVELLNRWGRDRERDLFMFLNDTGLRPWAEALPLTWKQIKTDQLVDVVGKSGALRIVPLTRRAQVILARQPKHFHGPWEGLNKFTLNDTWARVRAVLPHLDSEDDRHRTVWYTCRHTFASRMIQAGKPYGFVAKLMDNSVGMIEKVYGHLAPNHLKSAVDALEQFGGQETGLSLVVDHSIG